MKRLLKKSEVDLYNNNMFWAKNIRTNGLVKVKMLNDNYDESHCEVRYLDHNYIINNNDLITLADYDAFVNFAEENEISFDEIEQAMINNVSLEQFKQNI